MNDARHAPARAVRLAVDTGGTFTDLVLVPEGRKAVVWMANVDWMSHDPITNAALDAVMGFGPAPIEAVIGRLVAQYQVADITITDPPLEQIIAAIYAQPA